LQTCDIDCLDQQPALAHWSARVYQYSIAIVNAVLRHGVAQRDPAVARPASGQSMLRVIGQSRGCAFAAAENAQRSGSAADPDRGGGHPGTAKLADVIFGEQRVVANQRRGTATVRDSPPQQVEHHRAAELVQMSDTDVLS